MKDIQPGNIPQVLSERVNIMGVLDSASSCSLAAKLMPNVVSLLHRLVAHVAFPAASVDDTLRILERTVGLSDDVQLRALQCVMPLLTHYVCHKESLFKAYEVCFRLQASRSPTVINAAVAIIRQLIIWLFERVTEEDAEGGQPNGATMVPAEALVSVTIYNGERATLRPVTADAYVVMQDICLLVNEEAAMKLPLTSLNKCFGLELVESVLLYNAKIFHRHQVYASLIREKICPMVVKRLTEKSDFPLTCRLWRIVLALIKEFYDIFAAETEIFISCGVKLIDESLISWERALALETFRELLSEPLQVAHMEEACKRGQKESKLLSDLVSAVNNVILGLVAKLQGRDLIYGQVALKVAIGQQLEKANPPATTDAYLLLLSFECLSGFLLGFVNTCKGIKRIDMINGTSTNGQHGPILRAIKIEEIKDEEDVVKFRSLKGLIEQNWATILKSTTALLTSSRLDEEWCTKVISLAGLVIKSVSILQMKGAQNAVLQEVISIALPEYCLPSSAPSSMSNSAKSSPNLPSGSLLVSDLNLALSGMLLMISLEISELLGDSWVFIFQIVQGIDQFNVVKAKKAPESGQKQLLVELDKIGELAELCHQVVENSHNLSATAYLSFVQALCQLSSQMASGSIIAIFPAQKLKQIVLLNVDRFTEASGLNWTSFWELLNDQMDEILSSTDATMRGLGCETITLLMTQFATTIGTASFSDSLQLRILESLDRYSTKSTWSDVHRATLDSLYKLLQHLGPSITVGWPVVFKILSGTLLTNEANLTIIRGAFSSTKLICSEFLTSLPNDSIPNVVQVLCHFAGRGEDLNISLTAIGLLWDVADGVRREQRGDNRELWLIILEQLVPLSKDSRPEVRNSAIQTMLRAIEIGAASLSQQDWGRILENALSPLEIVHREPQMVSQVGVVTKSTVSSEMDLTHYTRDSSEKQWNETHNLIIQGVTQIYSKFLLTLRGVDKFESIYWKGHLNYLLFFCSEGTCQELVGSTIGSIAKLVDTTGGDDSGGSLCEDVWRCWCDIGGTMQPSSTCFTQDTLLKHVKVLPPLIRQLGKQGDREWINKSFGVLDASLQCPTPNDHVKDVDGPTELQRTVLEIIETLVDYDEEHQEVRSLFLRRIAGWAGWLNELPDVPMTRAISARRSRMGTASSEQSAVATAIIAPLHRQGVTFIGLVSVMMERLRGKVQRWSGDANIHEDGAFIVVIRSIGRLMNMKYRAPSGSGPMALWKLATKTFNSILAVVLPSSPPSSSPEDSNIWSVAIGLIETNMDVSKTQIPFDLSLEQLDIDEEFDIEQVMFIRDSLLPLMEGVQTRLIQRLLMSLEGCSRLYSVPEGASPGGAIQPVIKEKLAITALHTLFTVCTDHEHGELMSLHSRKSHTGMPPPLRTLPPSILHVALPILLDRCQGVIKAYIHDKFLLGRMPFPRVRQDEMIYVLSSLVELRLPKGLGEEVRSGGGLRRTLLGSTKGHLFYLYGEFCECLRLEEAAVVALIQKAFALMGIELGLINT